MNKLLATLVAGVFAASAAVAIAATPAATTKSDATTGMSDKNKYKDCWKKDAAGKSTMDQACKDKADKGAMGKGTDSMKGGDAMKSGDAMKGTVPTGADGKAAPKGK